MRYLAIDYGLKRLGVAICDANETIVSPLCRLQTGKNSRQQLLDQLRQMTLEHQVDAIVVGLPLNMDNSEGDQAKLTRKFADDLAQAVKLPVHMQDERLSSSAADEKLALSGLSRKKQRQKRDMLAACDILEEFLQRERQK
ncbi:MAG: Holliday junction resolvase RuvX [Planctomycetes bacterium]|nr:Holliday junction resolvase RuvX [Planctomycetota bacterium]